MSDEDPKDPTVDGGGGITDEEQREAQALVEALERGRAREAMPEDALGTAALLRYSRDGGEMPHERSEAVLGELLAGVKPRAASPARGRSLRWLYWLVPAGGLAAAAAALLVVVQMSREPAPVAVAPVQVGLPAPDASLLRAQAAAAGGDASAVRELAEEMEGYRGAMYAALDTRYGGR